MSGFDSAIALFAASLRELLCTTQERVGGRDNCVRYEGRVLGDSRAAPPPTLRQDHRQVHGYPDGTIALFHVAWRLAGYTEPLRPGPRQGSIPVGRNRRSATSFNQASVQSLVPVLPCRLSPDAGSRRNLNYSADTRPAGHVIEPVGGESVFIFIA
jgi:hypothetical protein